MTTYNSERFVSDQLDSLLKQERLPDELVVSDDASTDRTIEIVRDFAEKSPFPVRLLANKHNLGISRNLERSIAETTGDIIFLSDSDDYWYPQKILLMERALLNTPGAALAVCDSDLVDEQLRPLGVTGWQAIDRFSPGPRLKRDLALGRTFRRRMPAGASCMAFKAKFKPLILPLPGGEESRRHAHDHFMACVLVCSGAGGAALLPKPLLAYRQHSRQATHSSHTPLTRKIRRLAASVHERPYLLPLLIERLEGNFAEHHCANSTIRSSALTHWRARVNMPPSLAARLPVVARELISMRYHRFSGGVVTVAKDLFFSRQRSCEPR